jgi:hypothetical protein
MAGKKKVPEGRSGLRPSEKELPERRSDAFRHKNTPGNNNKNKFCRQGKLFLHLCVRNIHSVWRYSCFLQMTVRTLLGTA